MVDVCWHGFCNLFQQLTSSRYFEELILEKFGSRMHAVFCIVECCKKDGKNIIPVSVSSRMASARRHDNRDNFPDYLMNFVRPDAD